MPKYSYSYSVTECPECGHDLTEERGVELTVVVADVPRDGVFTSLRADGSLIDVDRLVENGYHGGTACGSCYEALVDYEEIDDE